MELTQYERQTLLKAAEALPVIAKELTTMRKLMEQDRQAEPAGLNPNYKTPRAWWKFW